MAFNLGGYAAAGGGADALQQMLAQAFKQQLEQRRAAQDDQRIKIEQQKADDEKAYRLEAMRTAAENRAASQKGANVATASRLSSDLPVGQNLDPSAVSALQAGDLGSLVKHEGADLPSTAISGVSQATNTAPLMGRLQMTEAGRPARDTYLGTTKQREEASQKADEERLINDPNIPANIRGFLRIRSAVPTGAVPAELFKPTNETEAVYQTGPNGKIQQVGTVPKGSHIANAPNPVQDHYNLQTIPDPNNPQKTIVVRVDTTTGQASPVTMNGTNLSGKSGVSPQTMQMAEGSKGIVEGALPRVRTAATALDQAGLFGPVAGRSRELLAGTIGSGQLAAQIAGNADPATQKKLSTLIGQYTTQLGLLKTAVARVHGGARGGGSPAMLQHMDHIMNGASSDLPQFLGSMQAVEDQLRDYMKEGGLDTAPPAAGDGSDALSILNARRKKQ